MEINQEWAAGVTNFKKTKLNYKWVIHDFDKYCEMGNGQYIKSPIFYVANNKDIKWYIQIFPDGETEDLKGSISIYLTAEAENLYVEADIYFYILDVNNKLVIIAHCTQTYVKNEDGYGDGDCMKKSRLLSKKNILMPGNTLTIICSLTATMNQGNLDNQKVITHPMKQFPLYNGLERLWRNQHLTDIKLVADNTELHAHKAVLAATSPVFLALLESNFKEKESSSIEFVDFSVEVLNEMLLFLYTGEVFNFKKNSYELVRLADKYDIQNLKTLCEEFLYNELCIENAIELLILGDLHNCYTLKPKILKFVVDNAKEVTKTAQFKVLQKDLPPLVVEMILAVT